MEIRSLYSNWKFLRGDASGAEAPDFDDSSWETVSVPHDWAVAGPFDMENDALRTAVCQDGKTVEALKVGHTGALPWVGVGWYRRKFTVPAGTGHAELLFDGAMSDSRVFVDGVAVGGRPNGYVPFAVDISGVLAPRGGAGGDAASVHVLAVRLENAPNSSRWYPGAGLIRRVRLATGPRTGLATWGTFAHTAALADGEARIAVADEVRGAEGRHLSLAWRVLDARGRVVASAGAEVADGAATGVLAVASPRPWTPDSPALYELESRLRDEGGNVIDSRRTRFGIRAVAVSGHGFLLNGRRIDFKGVCLHHDLGAIGAAFNPSAFRRQLRILKEMGCNAIRTAHNAPAPEQLDICDEMGVMVMAESFDEWLTPKCADGYSRFFRDWWRRDLGDIVRCHRNHPSVVLWSIGNEIPEADSRVLASLGREMVALCHGLDLSRPVTQAICAVDASIRVGAFQMLDLPGVNYHLSQYGEVRAASRSGFVLGSETASTVSSRGEYPAPDEEAANRTRPGSQCSSYDVECGSWGNLPDDDAAAQDDNAWAVGEFVWSGFDYLGEPSPYGSVAHWPSRSSYFGIFDLAGIPKDRYWFYRSRWNMAEPTLHILPHWTWTGREGEAIPVHVYTSWPTVELFVNGVSQGRRSKATDTRLDRFRLRWRGVKYEPGELKAVAYDAGGRAVAEETVSTAGAPCRIELLPEPGGLHATPFEDGEALAVPELAYVRVRIVDAAGNLCPYASHLVSFSVTGAASFKGVCNGDATSLEPFSIPAMHVFHGELTLTIEAGLHDGVARIEARAEGLKGAILEMLVETR